MVALPFWVVTAMIWRYAATEAEVRFWDRKNPKEPDDWSATINAADLQRFVLYFTTEHAGTETGPPARSCCSPSTSVSMPRPSACASRDRKSTRLNSSHLG